MILTRKRANGQTVPYEINAEYYVNSVNPSQSYYGLTIPTDDPNKNAGRLTFKMSKDGGRKMAWLLDVVVPKEYTGNGNGVALLQAMEYMAYKNLAQTIQGKFYPHDTDMTREEMIDFYERQGYSVDLYDKEIYKRVSIVNIVKNIEPNIKGFAVKEINMAELELDGM